ncbi:SDR family NAD(P)-dependent oxidoreductase [Sphingomonas sp. AOB5]|uniref:SDR family oxidoreductase n=1 Tax=Sphingomonas sp. AOB5 TaxID=3034017 RepID=UPI0023F66921|nr:SDR family oxidoreductase [Sphingomonas sp. AOB5]MDF7774811.1 SDR family NAD(P)-dependent oxidoreductase [Sphingomonas sp. AOB5]
MELKDRIVVVTGAAGGIGAAMAARFARDGARCVIVTDRDAEGAKRSAAAIREAGGSAEAHGLDVSSEAAIAALVDDVTARFGGIDLFCSNAGVIVEGGAEAPDSGWDLSWSVNVMAHVHAARAVLPQMLARGEGYILNTASSAGLLTALGAAPYSVTKHAAVAFAEWLAITYGDRGIRVSLLCPQAVKTAMLDAATSGSAASAVKSAGVVLTPEHVADQVGEAIAAERFLILTHDEIGGYMQRKAADTDRWIGGMRRFAAAAAQGD